MAQTPKTEPTHVGDVVKYETPFNFCRKKLTLKAATTQSVEVGSPLRDNTGYILVANGQEANATAIALEAVEATGGEEIVCLVRGPAVIDADRLHLETGVSWSELEPYFAALGILAREEPDKLTTGPEVA